MKREIKFRAWSTEQKKFISGYPVGQDIKNGFTIEGIKEEYDHEMEDDGLELMQYTGLKDKNGLEIYEGDIVRWEHGDGSGIGNCGKGVDYIGYDNTYATFGLFKNGEYTNKELSFFKWSANALEVIGNIYENPELIK